jgi:DNA-binding beta-propeller fold protein YncE
MAWPVPQDYNEAVQDPAVSFADSDLRAGTAATDALGLPRPCSGNFADVYEVRCPGGTWAVKCFTRQVAGLRQRYAAVSDHLARARLPFGVKFHYLEQGIRVSGRWFPVVKMRWVEGWTLNEFVRANLDKPALLEALGHIWQRMAGRLREADVAHGELQHGNVLLVPGSSAQSLAVKLIDYDGMYVPALADKPSGEVGHPNYQHPQRLREGTYGPDVDRFGLLVVAAALRCLRAGGRGLWERYDNGDNLLFKEADFADPHQSPLFAELLRLDDAVARAAAARLMAAAQQPLAQTPLLEEVFPDRPVAATPPPLPAPAAQPVTTAEAFRFDTEDAGVGKRKRRKRKSALPLALGMGLALAGGLAWWATRPTSRPRENYVAVRDTKPTAPQTTAKVEPHHTGQGSRKEKPPETEPNTRPGDNGTPPPGSEPDAPVRQLAWTLDNAHAGTVRRLAVSPNGTQVLTAGYDGMVRLWDLASHKQLRRLYGHRSSNVHAVAFLPGNRAVSAGADKGLRVWDLSKGKQIDTWAGGETYHLAVSIDGHRLLSCGPNGPALVWDTAEGTVVHRLDVGGGGASNGAFSRDGRLAATVGADGFVRVWDVAKGTEVIKFDKGRGGEGVAFSPDGKQLLAAQDKTLRLWDVPTGTDRLRLEGHTQGVYAVAFSPDGRRAVSASGDRTVRVWDLATGEEVARLTGHAGWIGDVAFLAGGRNVLSASEDHSLRLWPLQPPSLPTRSAR